MNQPLHLPLARSAVDRDYLLREQPGVLDELLQDPLTRILFLNDGLTLLQQADGAPSPELKLYSAEQVTHLNLANANLIAYLGQTLDASATEPAGTRVLLIDLSVEIANQLESDSDRWHHLRRTGAGLSARDAGLFSEALALANWHATHQFCSRCGGATEAVRAGWVRKCKTDDQQLFPRTDPAIIASVIDSKDRILLGSQGAWEENRWSILAGFVEPGESLSAAVIREIYEEAGVRVVNPQYLGSQAWPFPYSLMVGFTAQVDPEFEHFEPVPDGDEIVKLRWFSREEMAAERHDLLLPAPVSIARAIIERWYGQSLEADQ